MYGTIDHGYVPLATMYTLLQTVRQRAKVKPAFPPANIPGAVENLKVRVAKFCVEPC